MQGATKTPHRGFRCWERRVGGSAAREVSMDRLSHAPYCLELINAKHGERDPVHPEVEWAEQLTERLELPATLIGICHPAGSQSEKYSTTSGRPSFTVVLAIR